MVGFARARRIPILAEQTLRRWNAGHQLHHREDRERVRRIYLFADEFTNYNETGIGIKTILLLEKLGYKVVIPRHSESGRTFLSKGLLKRAKNIAESNVMLLKDVVSDDSPLVGLEPSAILTFRDEYPDIVNDGLKEPAKKLGRNALLLEEFICREAEKGHISAGQFTAEKAVIKLHGHCQQKSIASTAFTKRMLSIPVNYEVEEIPSGCCGMAGSFGYEKEHYDLSMKIGEMVLFPAVRSAPEDVIIAAPGTSCRAQILDGTGRRAFHPAEIMYDALMKT
jgi:Fe-S oxidoreductase